MEGWLEAAIGRRLDTAPHGVAHSFSQHAACGNWRPHVFAPHGPEHMVRDVAGRGA